MIPLGYLVLLLYLAVLCSHEQRDYLRIHRMSLTLCFSLPCMMQLIITHECTGLMQVHLSDTADSCKWCRQTAHSDRVSILTCKQWGGQGMVDKLWEGCILGIASVELVIPCNSDLRCFEIKIMKYEL